MSIEYVKETYQLRLKPLFMRAAKYFGGKEGIYSVDHDGKGLRFTWHEAHERLCRLANALENLGVEQGDKVGTFAWNTHRHGEISLAVPMMGSVFHPINFRYGRDHLIHTVNHAKDKIIFVDEDIIPLVEDIRDGLNTVESYVIMTPADKLPQTNLSPAYSYEDLLRQASAIYDFPDDIPENSLAMLTYTGGTTGVPKGIPWSPRSIVLSVLGLNLPDQLALTEEDTTLLMVPLFHVNGQNLILIMAMMGGKIVLPGPHPSPDDILRILEKEKVTCFGGVTAIINFALQQWEKGKYDLSSVKSVVSGSTAPNKALIEAIESKGLTCWWSYGLAEGRVLSNTVASNKKHMMGWSKEKYFEKMTHQGLPMVGVEVRVVSLDTGKDVAWDGKEKGEVLIKGLWPSEEYYDAAEATSGVFKDGWLHTGDVAVIEEDGYLWLVDRLKDIIKSGAEWISSVDLENAIMNNPAVSQAAVFGIPDLKWEERPVAAIVLKDEYKGRVSEEDIIEPLKSKFADWWMPDHVLFLDDLPMTGTMKVMKMVLREMWVKGEFSKKENQEQQ